MTDCLDCLFCKIVDGEIPANTRYEDEYLIAFDDIAPQAPVHCLIIPKRHIATLNDLDAQQHELMGRIVTVAATVANQLNIADAGYRLVWNCNAAAGQTVFHIHCHLLGGRDLTWPPG